MKKLQILLMFFFVMMLSITGVKGAVAASGKCTVVKVDGSQMVIECNKETKGFSQGNEIKIKTDKKRDSQKK